MAWTAPRDWTTGEVVTATWMNAHIRDNLRYLKGLDGAATFESDLTVDNLITTGNVDGVDVGDHAANTTTAHGAVSTATASKHVVRDASARAKFAAPGAAGDTLIKGTRITADELPAVTDEYYLVGTGANVEERAVPSTATKEFFIFPTAASQAAATYGDHSGSLIDAEYETAAFEFYIPNDYSSITNAVVVVIPQSSATHRLEFRTDYGASGEAYNTHSEGTVDVDTVLVDDQIAEIDISGDLSSIAAGDYVGLRVLGEGTTNIPNLYVIGLRFKYS